MPLDILIIPDVHEKIDLADHIVQQYPDVQKRIWLGDYLDSFEYENQPEHWKKVCEWMDRISQDPKNILLIGNHDVHYFCNISEYQCSGYFGSKHHIVKNILGHSWISKLKWIHAENVNGELTVFSHAGLNPALVNPMVTLNCDYFADLNNQIHEKFSAGLVDPLLSAGRGRWGSAPIGGLTWQDWRREYAALPGVRQVVGHSETHLPSWKGYDLCVDTQLTHVALMDSETNMLTTRSVDLTGFAG